MNSIPNADLIRAVLDGKTVQFREPAIPDLNKAAGEWKNYMSADILETVADLADALRTLSPDNAEWRIKPDLFVRWHPVLKMPGGSTVIISGRISKKDASNPYNFPRGEWNQNDKLVGVLRIELDPDTLDVVKAETEKVE